MRKDCTECGNACDTKVMIQFGEYWVCADCKPILVQKLKEGVPKERPIGLFRVRAYCPVCFCTIPRWPGIQKSGTECPNCGLSLRQNERWDKVGSVAVVAASTLFSLGTVVLFYDLIRLSPTSALPLSLLLMVSYAFFIGWELFPYISKFELMPEEEERERESLSPPQAPVLKT